MIPLPPSTRIFLACGATDMRNYALTMIMRSRRVSSQDSGIFPIG
ncbi:Transposase [Novosphingobium sp. Rr 2-17]|nr:Transposase [Novosphingobium sp. Rr 2-17]